MDTELQVLCKSLNEACVLGWAPGYCPRKQTQVPSSSFINSEAGNHACLAESIFSFFFFAYTIIL